MTEFLVQPVITHVLASKIVLFKSLFAPPISKSPYNGGFRAGGITENWWYQLMLAVDSLSLKDVIYPV